uniref:Uncharacterized protein n=1 Tax=Cannabis sativa TaxID=3483 RepID=A0A803NJ77_CANSA
MIAKQSVSIQKFCKLVVLSSLQGFSGGAPLARSDWWCLGYLGSKLYRLKAEGPLLGSCGVSSPRSVGVGSSDLIDWWEATKMGFSRLSPFRFWGRRVAMALLRRLGFGAQWLVVSFRSVVDV